VVTRNPTTIEMCSYTTLQFVFDHNTHFRLSVVFWH